MSIVKFNPAFRALSKWPDFWDDDFFTSPVSSASNNLDVYETEDEVVVKANVAGIKADDIDMTFEKNTLWIKAEAVAEEADKEKTHYSKSSWSYSYKVAVPGHLDLSKEPESNLENGVLSITFKKSEHTKPRKLTIKTK